MSLPLLATTTIPSAITSGNMNNDPLRRTTTKFRQLQVGNRNRMAYTSSEQKQNKDVEVDGPNNAASFDRRNILFGLGGMYGASAVSVGNNGGMLAAIGAPFAPPDLSKCHLATDDETKAKVECCPPYSSATIIDFKPPSSKEPLRVRKPAHKLTSDEISKFEMAVSKMKNLKPDDPWNFMQQATIHCTYCNGAYNQAGTNNLLQVHGSWFFLPWHRCYLYFWERILGKLIDDPTFAVPYWNWDTPKGMYMPKIYLKKKSPLFDETRDKNHYKSVLDYNYSYENPTNPATPAEVEKIIKENMCRMDSIFSKDATFLPSLFMGKPLRGGEAPIEAAGSCEQLHNTMHQWVGPTKSPHYNMGNFHTAARDTMFFGHHANVDRTWDLFNKSRGGKPEFKDPDWLESEFIFYDENRQVVKVKVKDCLTPEKLRYSYQDEKLPWKGFSRKCIKKKKADNKKKNKAAGDSMKMSPVSEFGSQPQVLIKEVVRSIIKRPKKSRSKFDKEDATEVLVIKGIQVTGGTCRFDVFVTKPIEGSFVGPQLGEWAGNFVKIPHGHHENSSANANNLELGLTTLLEDIDAEDSESLVVSLVPRHGEVSVEGIEILLCNHEDDYYGDDDYEDYDDEDYDYEDDYY